VKRTERWALGPGADFGGYLIEGVLGRQNGAGSVYRARNIATGDPVALKVFPPRIARDATFRLCFEELAHLQAELEHPHIAKIHDVGTTPGPYMAMTFVRGRTLADLIASGGMHDKRVLDLLTPVADALDYAYTHFGLVYRRLEPRSIIVANESGADHAYLGDFGAARPGHSTQLIESGRLGSFADYISPEEVQGAEPDLASNVYSFGAIVYECFSGEPPHLYEETREVLRAHLEEPPRPLSALRPDLAPKIESVLAKALAKEPRRRYRSPVALMRAVAEAHPKAAASRGPAPAREERPQATSKAPRHRRRSSLVFALATCALVALAASLGFGLAGEYEARTVPARSAESPALSLSHRADWKRLTEAPAVPGLPLTDTVALSAPGGRREGVLLAGRVSDAGSGALERSSALGGPRPAAVQLGQAHAFKAAGLPGSGLGRDLVAYLVPTTAAPVVIACLRGPASSRSFTADCERTASTIQLKGAQSLRLGLPRGYSASIDGLVSRLAAQRRAGRRRLSRAAAVPAQREAVAGLARAHRQATRALSGVSAPSGLERANARLAAALRRAGRGYAEMAAAARRSDSRAWARGARAVRSGERGVRRALAAIQGGTGA